MEQLHCPKCLYCLRGLTANRCPECGEPFEWNDLREAEAVPEVACVLGSGFLILVTCTVASLPAYSVAWLSSFDEDGRRGPLRNIFVTMLALLGLVAAAWIGGAIARSAWHEIRQSRRIRGRNNEPLTAGVCLAIVLVLALALIYLPITIAMI